MQKITSFLLKDETGATAVEYGLMVALIAVLIITFVASLGLSINNIFNEVADQL